MPTQPQTVTIAQARASTASGLMVLDSGANIVAALPNTALAARIASFTLSGPASLTAAQMSLLFPIASKLHAAAGALQLTGANTFSVAQLTSFEALSGFAVASTGSIALSDTATQIVGVLLNHLAWFGQVTSVSIQLDGSSMGAYPATLLENMILHGKSVVFVPTTGHTTLNIAAAAHDLATNAASLNALATHQALTISLSNDGTAISATDAASLLTLQGFSPFAHTLTITDSGANISAHLAVLLGTGYGQITVTSGTLSGTASQLLNPWIHFAAGTHAQLSASATVNLSVAASLAALPGFGHATGAILTVADTAANLIAANGTWLTAAGAVALTANATVSASGAAQLSSIAANIGGALSLGGHSLTVSDTLPALVSLPAPAASLATNFTLSANAVANAAQLAAFANLSNATLGGHTITLTDSAANVLASAPAALALASGVSLSADAVVSAANANSLAVLPGFSTAGHAVTVSDTAAGLLTLTPAALAVATSTLLSADASVTAQQAQTIFYEPGFSTAGHQLSISDTAANLLSLPHGVQVASTLLTLSGNQTVNAATATQLAALGIKFSEAGHSLTVQDTAANLATLPVNAVALASGEVLGTSATVSASVAASLAALPNLSLASGVTLSVQDSVANLISLGQGASAFASTEFLPSGNLVTITAAQATALASLPHFSNFGATVTIADTIANLNIAGPSTLSSIGNVIEIVDTAANLAANSATSLLQNAASVTLSGNAQVSAASAAQIASIPHFSSNTYQLTVTDTAAHVASHASTIIAVATQAVVTDSGPINITTADQLATVSSAGILSFQGGNQLLVQDSFAALTSAGNSTGFALAARIGVIDTPANLVAASAHNWGGLNPSYTLSQGGAVSAATASSLAGLGSHFSAGGYVLSVADTAAATVAAASALNSLQVRASVTDSVANLDTQASSLISLGTAITQIRVSDSTPVTASVASGLSTLSGLLTGPALQVVDTAAHIDTSLTALTTLGMHIAVTVSDSAANVVPHVNDLATLGSVSIALNDSLPVTASVATSLAPVASELITGTILDISDTGADIAAHSAGLSAMSSNIGLITISDGTTLSASDAAAFASLDIHLASGVVLTATGTAASIASNLTALESLNTDHRLAAIVVSGASVADATTNVAALNALPAQVTISDTAANVDAGLTALAAVSGLQTIALTDAGTPSLSMSLASLAADAAVLAKIATPYSVTISDTATHIAADLALGGMSVIAGHLSQIGQIAASDGQPVVLTQTQLLAAGVDDGAGSAMAKFAGTLDVSAVDIGHLAQITLLGHAPTAVSVVDTGSDIAADLALGNASTIVSTLPFLTSITASDGQSVSLTAAQAMATGVDDASHSAIGLLQGANLDVTAANVADLSGLAGLYVQPTSIAVSDTAVDISADLASGSSALVAGLPTIDAIAVSDGQTITLTEQQVLATHVDDGTGSVLAETTGGQLAVTHVAASDLAEMLGLGVAPESISITDSSAHVVSDLGSVISDIGDISAINITGAPLVLTAAEALSAHVDDGAGSLLDLVAGHGFTVSGASVAQLPSLLTLPYAPTSVAVTDSSSNIVGDLMSGNPLLPAAGGSLGTITVTHGTLTLTDAQADAIMANPSLDGIFGHLAASTVVSVTGVPISDLANVTGSGWPHVTAGVADTPADIAADLSSGASVLLNNSAATGSVTLTANGSVSAATLTGMAGLNGFSTGAFALTVHDSISAIQGLSDASLTLAHQVDIVDTAANLSTSLDALQNRFSGNLSITLSDAAPVVAVTAATYVTDHATIASVTNPGAFCVLLPVSSISDLASMLGTDPAVASVNISDFAANVLGQLDALQLIGGKLYVFLYDTQITANLVSPLLAVANLTSPAIPVVDTGSQIAAVVETGDTASIAYLNAYGASLVDSTPVSAADVVALESLGTFSKNGQNLVVWDTAQHLATSAYAAALNNGLVDSVHLKTPGGTVTVTAATAAALFGITGFTTSNPSGTSNALIVSDTAAHIDTNLAALTTNMSHISSIIVSSSATVADSVMSDLQGLGVSAAAGVQLTVRDTGSVIAANATSQSSGHSILPSTWTLSGNATLTEAAATVLGGLSNFSTGPYTITLNLGSDTSISIADANKLGNLAGALNLGGHQLIVGGSVTQLATLSSAALLVAKPALADTLANIDTLTQTSPLLQGTVEVTGNDTLSASAVSTLFNLLRAGAGPGISSGSLSFDSAHAVDDSIANLRSLTSSASWTANVGLHSAFSLFAQDTVGNLINPANTVFLSGLSAATLQSDVTVGASTASSLAALSNTIHFNRGTFHVTVQDSAANLLNASNSGGVGFADTVVLAGPDHLDASDAEALLAITHFNLNTSLTIIDSSSNLLDGTLSGDIAGSGFGTHIQVQLAGPETLDAQTAESLVSIPGFADTQNLSIADDPSYLLDSANLTAEQMAVHVTLAGDETVSANTVLRLSEVPHFTPGSSQLVLASNDFANAATLKAVADMGSAFNHNGHSLTMTADVLNLTPTEYAALQADGVVQNGHALGIQPTGASASDSSNVLSVSGSGIAGGTVKIYAADGSLISSNVQATAGFTVSAADTGSGHNFSVTEVVNGSVNEGAPLLVLDAGALESVVTASGGSFSSSGAIQVDTGKFVNLYLAGAVPALTHAALVYDPSTHTLALDVPGQSPVTLVTLGGSTHPATLDVSEILFKTHG